MTHDELIRYLTEGDRHMEDWMPNVDELPERVKVVLEKMSNTMLAAFVFMHAEIMAGVDINSRLSPLKGGLMKLAFSSYAMGRSEALPALPWPLVPDVGITDDDRPRDWNDEPWDGDDHQTDGLGE